LAGRNAVTLELLSHWWDQTKVSRRQYPFYFCQLEAIETLIWMLEAQPEYRRASPFQGDGGAFERLCNKMATGQRQDHGDGDDHHLAGAQCADLPQVAAQVFSRAIFLVAPGLTVKSRLQVLMPGHLENYYDSFELCPSEAMRQKLNRPSPDRELAHADAAEGARTLGGEEGQGERRSLLPNGCWASWPRYKDLVVINDEAHHAYRKPAELQDQQGRCRRRSALTWTKRPAGWRGWTACTRPGALALL
jgi:type III restriction enzyme